AAGDAGEHARRSVVRRAYLYLALFAGVIGGMGFAVALIFELLNTVLTGERSSNFSMTVLNDLQLLLLFVVLLVYHLAVMRRDGRFAAAALVARHKAFKLLVVDAGQGFAAGIQEAMRRVAPNVSVAVAAREPRGKFDAMVVAGSALLTAAPWVRNFGGRRIVVPDAVEGVHWVGGLDANPFQKAALTARQLAEGQAIAQTPKRSGWMIAVYVAAALFGIEIILMLFGLVASTFMR
ncbi:MAG TPA: DUF5671 domain-containing protein, partial [Anaerolineales bacterium]|nr:DUF5671 domain-containing protein [Anaerolineales bacterium]